MISLNIRRFVWPLSLAAIAGCSADAASPTRTVREAAAAASAMLAGPPFSHSVSAIFVSTAAQTNSGDERPTEVVCLYFQHGDGTRSWGVSAHPNPGDWQECEVRFNSW